MRIGTYIVALGLLGALGMWSPQSARAAEITVFLNQATESGVRELGAAFEKATGNKVNVSFQGGAALNQKIAAGARRPCLARHRQFAELVKEGKIVPGTVVEYGRVGNGVAVKAGAPKPDISTPEAFKRAMLNAKSIGHTSVGTGPFNTSCSSSSASTTRSRTRSKSSRAGSVAAAVADWRCRDRHPADQCHPALIREPNISVRSAELMQYGRRRRRPAGGLDSTRTRRGLSSSSWPTRRMPACCARARCIPSHPDQGQAALIVARIKGPRSGPAIRRSPGTAFPFADIVLVKTAVPG